MSKALELIIEDLMRKSAAIAEERSSKSITPQHLKECVTREESYDFLRETFSKVRTLRLPRQLFDQHALSKYGHCYVHQRYQS